VTRAQLNRPLPVRTRRTPRLLAVPATVVVLIVFASGCAERPEATQPGGVAAKRTFVRAKDFDSANFDRSTPVMNPWFPLRPGTQFVYEGQAFDEDEGERISRRVVLTVTDLTKVIDGVRTVVLWDRDYDNDDLVESELAFFAQDNGGTVWHFGQYPEESEGGKVVGVPAWIADVAGATPGISMQAQPRFGTPAYAQGYAPPPINWVDRARVYRVGQRTCVPVTCYENVLVIDEFEPDKPGAYQLKYYARGVGNVRVGWMGPKEKEKEQLQLVTFEQLDERGLAQLRGDVQQLEKRAYRLESSKDFYARTKPAEQVR
jgi:hypothetical protein